MPPSFAQSQGSKPSFLISLALVLMIGLVSASAAPLAVKAVNKQADGVTLQLATGALELQVCGDRTIHVLYAPTGDLPKGPHGLAVLKEPAPGAFEVNETNDSVTLTVAKGGAVVDKHTGAITFLGADGKPLLREVADGGKSVTPSTVANLATNTIEQTFVRDPAEGLFGLGQQPTGQFNYSGTTVHLQQKNTKIAIPVLVSSKGYGVFWNNPAVTDVVFSAASAPNATVDWKSEFGSAIDYYVFIGPSLDEVIGAYRDLTGAAPLMGRWGYGFWQCKQRYQSQQELLDVAARYRQMKVPIDGIIQDWLWWYPNPWGSHIFGADRYPDPAAMMQQLHAENVHLLISVWAKFDVGSDNAKELEAAGALFPQVISYVYPPGKGQWYDPFGPVGRQTYWSQVSREIFSKGVDGWWLDASEAELSGKWGELRSYKTAAGPGAEVYNAYPLMHTASVYEGQRAENPAKRVFILTRSAYAGQQRNAAVAWSGDIRGDWATFKMQIPDGLNFCLSGLPYWNTDTGGFFTRTPAPLYPELFTRWFQFSAFCPMFRVHGDATKGDKEPVAKADDVPGKEMWNFPPETEKILIAYDKLRYHLLPYIYSTAWQVTSAGSTMMRGLVMDFPRDAQVYNIPDQYLFGPAIMVNPVTAQGATSRKVYLPAGTSWVDFWTGKPAAGGQTVDAAAPIETLPLFVRAGSIIPYGPEVQSAMEPEDTMELRVYRGANGSFTLYEDEGDSYDYEKGAYATVPFSWNEKAGILTIGKRTGAFPGMSAKKTFRVVWVSPGHGVGIDSTAKADAVVTYTGEEVQVPFSPQ